MRNFLYGAAMAGAIVVAVAGYFAYNTAFATNSQARLLPVDAVPLVAETNSGEKQFTIEVADTADERASGLMFREEMEDDHGMLFIFEQTQPVGFWMRNTPMPLDLLFVGQDGRVRDIKQGEPFSEAVISPDEPVRFVLELKAGTAERQGIADGTQLRHPAIGSASIPGNSVGTSPSDGG